MELEKLKYQIMSNKSKCDIKLSEKQNDAFSLMIKGENILLTGETVKLADLGSCRGLF
jgi:serine/threonine protein kinase